MKIFLITLFQSILFRYAVLLLSNSNVILSLQITKTRNTNNLITALHYLIFWLRELIRPTVHRERNVQMWHYFDRISLSIFLYIVLGNNYNKIEFNRRKFKGRLASARYIRDMIFIFVMAGWVGKVREGMYIGVDRT